MVPNEAPDPGLQWNQPLGLQEQGLSSGWPDLDAGPEAGGGATGKSVHPGQSEQRRDLGNEVRGTEARAARHIRRVPELRSDQV